VASEKLLYQSRSVFVFRGRRYRFGARATPLRSGVDIVAALRVAGREGDLPLDAAAGPVISPVAHHVVG
jgi:hypothetical protein